MYPYRDAKFLYDNERMRGNISSPRRSSKDHGGGCGLHCLYVNNGDIVQTALLLTEISKRISILISKRFIY